MMNMVVGIVGRKIHILKMINGGKSMVTTPYDPEEFRRAFFEMFTAVEWPEEKKESWFKRIFKRRIKK